jgi:lipoprotein-anchoring transpeptidase ErfK/SrfK
LIATPVSHSSSKTPESDGSLASQKNSLPDISAFKPLLNDLRQRFPKHPIDPLIIISASEQKLYLIEHNAVSQAYSISTAEAGLGSRSGSNKTPLGVHRIAEKFGDKAAPGTIFKARRNTGRIAKILTQPGARSKADNVTTRILWLSGLEDGINKGGKVDSHKRYIYIHGTDEEGRLGKPASHGCIRMTNKGVIEVFNKVPVGTLVNIIE